MKRWIIALLLLGLITLVHCGNNRGRQKNKNEKKVPTSEHSNDNVQQTEETQSEEGRRKGKVQPTESHAKTSTQPPQEPASESAPLNTQSPTTSKKARAKKKPGHRPKPTVPRPNMRKKRTFTPFTLPATTKLTTAMNNVVTSQGLSTGAGGQTTQISETVVNTVEPKKVTSKKIMSTIHGITNSPSDIPTTRGEELLRTTDVFATTNPHPTTHKTTTLPTTENNVHSTLKLTTTQSSTQSTLKLTTQTLRKTTKPATTPTTVRQTTPTSRKTSQFATTPTTMRQTSPTSRKTTQSATTPTTVQQMTSKLQKVSATLKKESPEVDKVSTDSSITKLQVATQGKKEDLSTPSVAPTSSNYSSVMQDPYSIFGVNTSSFTSRILMPVAIGIILAVVITLTVCTYRKCQNRRNKSKKRLMGHDMGGMDRVMLLADSSEDEF